VLQKNTKATDFIAGYKALNRQRLGYTPTSIKDLKQPSVSGIQSIAPPSANGREQQSTFSIEIPAEEEESTTILGLQYDSDGGHSWAGMGWDVSAAAM
jgi:hypothetical protein